MFHQSCKSRLCQAGRAARVSHRRGLTLLELLLAMSILVMIAGSLGALAEAVQSGAEFGESHGTAVQHARVTLERITRTVSKATANEAFPGILVVSESIGSWRFPDTLVVWHPRTAPRNPEGLPCYDELVVYCPHPKNANQLVEITLPENSDSRTVPAVTETAAWLAELEVVKRTEGVVLTDLLRTGLVSESNQSTRRGMVRFVERLRPSSAEWEEYQQGKRDWNKLSWVLGIFGPQTGLRQAWVRIELQLVPTTASGVGNEHEAIPFLGSATLYYDMHAKAN